MSIFAVVLEFVDDKDLVGDTRPLHRQNLASLVERKIIVEAGPWTDGSGGMIVYDLPGRDELDEVLADEPYFKASAVKSWSVYEWRTLVGALGA